MSIYSEYAHGYITEAEFNTLAYQEYADDNDYDDDYDDDYDEPTATDITNCLEANFCNDCEGEWCDGCLVDKTIKAVEGGKI